MVNAPLLLAISFFSSPGSLASGTWLPTSGGAGERAIQAVVAAEDGALYAAGAGRVFRLELGSTWKQVGRFAPRLRWDGDQGIDALGDFPKALLDQVEDEAEAALELMGLDDEALATSEDLVPGLLKDFVEEAATRPDSAYRITGFVPSTRGVWLATGAGLFWADAQRVVGPLGALGPLKGLAATSEGLVAAKQDGLYRIDAGGKAWLWRTVPVDGLATMGGQLVVASDGRLLVAQGQNLNPLSTPTGKARRIFASDKLIFAATDSALYRYDGEWRLCAALPDLPVQVQAAGGQMVVATTESLLVGPDTCESYDRIQAPWPGGVVFTDALLWSGSLWGATNEGVFVLGPSDDDARMALQMDGFKRTIKQLPTFSEISQQAMAYHRLTPASTDYGSRPMLRYLLPDLRVELDWLSRRNEDLKPLDRGAGLTASGRTSSTAYSEQVETFPEGENVDFRIMAEWTIRFDSFLSLFDAERVAVEEELASLEGLATTQEITEAAENPEYYAEEGEDGEVVLVALEGDEADAVDEVDADERTSTRLAVERRQMLRDRELLGKNLRRLYRDRIRLTHRLWAEKGAGLSVVEQVLRIDEIDALIDALTGGHFTAARAD